ncbi:PHP domain-containing protein [soil metagenome]
MRIDLHTHSRMSDGTDTPAGLVHAAAAVGLDVVALTDHDTAVGWPQAAAQASEVGVEFVPGMEISTRLEADGRGHSVHLLGYYLDPTLPDLVAELDKVLSGRDGRVPGMVERLNELGIPITVDLVRRLSADTTATGRPHVADAMIHLGAVADRDEAFERFLSPGRPAYVGRYAVDLAEAIRLVRRAGGVPVIAHPWGRTSNPVLTEPVLADLVAAGLVGIEVDHQDHPPAQRDALRAIAANLDLVVTGSSDYHGTGKVDHGLGCNTTAPEQFERIKGSRGHVDAH